MSESLEQLVARRQVLVARASLQRLTLLREAATLRQGLRLPHAASALVSSPAARSALGGVALLLLGRTRFGRMLRTAAAVLAVARVALAFAKGKGKGDVPV